MNRSRHQDVRKIFSCSFDISRFVLIGIDAWLVEDDGHCDRQHASKKHPTRLLRDQQVSYWFVAVALANVSPIARIRCIAEPEPLQCGEVAPTIHTILPLMRPATGIETATTPCECIFARGCCCACSLKFSLSTRLASETGLLTPGIQQYLFL